MRKWPLERRVLRIPEAGEGGGGTGTEEGTGKGATEPTTYKINGKDVSIEALSQAINLQNALTDPDIGPTIIEKLAEQSGLLNKEGNLKGTVKETERKLEGKLTKLFKAKLGKDFEKFSDTVGPLMDEAIEQYLEEHKTTVERSSGEASWDAAVEQFTESVTLTPDIETMMTNLIKRNGGRPNLKGKEAVEWMHDMYELAVHKLGIEPPDSEAPSRNRSSKSERRSRRDEVPEYREVDRPKGPLTIDQIVDAAMRGQRFRS